MEPHDARAEDGRIRFGEFEVDLESRELTRNGTRVKLQDKPFEVLKLVLAEPHKLVTRERLRRNLWPADTFVDFEAGLNTAIRKLRDALQDEAKAPRFIETVQRHGYRFIAPLERAAGPRASERAAPAPERPTSPSSRRWFPLVAASLATATLLLLFGLNVAGLRERLLPRAHERRIQSLAVLPLQNLSGDPAQEYFADGMTEALITGIGKIGTVRVISRTSAMQYKGTHKTLPQVARELSVDAVLEGAVLRSGSRVRITTQLIEVPADRQIWAQSYERDLVDVLALQNEVARAVANEVRVRVSPGEAAQVALRRPVTPEAYDAYLKGRYEWNDWSEEHLQKSVAAFQQAVRLDPGYAPAWAGLSDSYGLSALFGFLPEQLALERSKAAALRALELDNTLSEAHFSLANVLLWEWSWSAAEQELQRAIALDPNNASAHQWYGYLLSALGRFDAAISEMQRAKQLDPLSANRQNSLAATYYRAGRYDEALQEFRAVPDPDANSEFRHRRIAAIYERKGMTKEAVDALLVALKFGGKTALAASVQRKFFSSGYESAKEAFLHGDLREMQARYRSGSPGVALAIAEDYALLGERDHAFEWLEKALETRDKLLMYLKVNDRLEGLRSDPRFLEMERRMGLADGGGPDRTATSFSSH